MAPLTRHQKAVELLDSYIALLEAQLPPIPCPECKRAFSQKSALEAHQREALHASCYNCDVIFPTNGLYVLHMQLHSPGSARTLFPATQFRCCDCKRDFKSEGALRDHLHCSKVHRPGKEANKMKTKKQNEQGDGGSQMGCKKCNKTFKDRTALTLHLSSVRHHPLSDIKCLADAECKKRFNCPSGQLQHLESGQCLSRTTKTKLNRAVIAKDTGRIISQWLPEDNLFTSATSTSQTRSPILTPTSTEFLGAYPSLSTSTNLHSMLTLRLRSQSGSRTCHLCPASRTRRFEGKALQQHLLSSVHAQMLVSLQGTDEISFHCPRTFMGEGSQNRPLKQFSTVSGLAQHLESGAYDGGAGTLRCIIEYVQEEMKGMGFGELKLLR